MKKLDELGISPAPWYRNPYDGGAIPDVVESSDGDIVLNRMAWCDDDKDKVLIANARLIAAAPDLYEALRVLVGIHENGAKEDMLIPAAWEYAKIALAKASGESEVGK